MVTATRILSLFLFLQVGFFSLPFPWSLHRFFNACRGQFESYFLVLCVVIRLVSLPALKHCRSTDWSRILRRSEKQDSLQSKAPARKKLLWPLWYHKAPRSSSPAELPRIRENCFPFIIIFGQYCFRLTVPSPKA